MYAKDEIFTVYVAVQILYCTVDLEYRYSIPLRSELSKGKKSKISDRFTLSVTP